MVIIIYSWLSKGTDNVYMYMHVTSTTLWLIPSSSSFFIFNIHRSSGSTGSYYNYCVYMHKGCSDWSDTSGCRSSIVCYHEIARYWVQDYTVIDL